MHIIFSEVRKHIILCIGRLSQQIKEVEETALELGLKHSRQNSKEELVRHELEWKASETSISLTFALTVHDPST